MKENSLKEEGGCVCVCVWGGGTRGGGPYDELWKLSLTGILIILFLLWQRPPERLEVSVDEGSLPITPDKCVCVCVCVCTHCRWGWGDYKDTHTHTHTHTHSHTHVYVHTVIKERKKLFIAKKMTKQTRHIPAWFTFRQWLCFLFVLLLSFNINQFGRK